MNELRPSVRTINKWIGLGLKLTVTVGCFWFAVRQVSLSDLKTAATTLDARWILVAVLILMMQIPLVGVRWAIIVRKLSGREHPAAVTPIICITAISIFLGQVLPNLVGDSMRAWLLARLGFNWRMGIASVIIDRAVGVATLLAVGFTTLLFPSTLTALGGHRAIVLELFGALLAGGILALIAAPWVYPILSRFSYLRWVGTVALSSRHLLLRSRTGFPLLVIAFVVHLFTISAVWSLGLSQGLSLSLLDAATLFTVMVVISTLPVSIGGWGLRELAVTSLLSAYGLPPEQALFFSVCFGLVLIAASLPGALVWALYSPGQIVSDSPAGG